MKSISMLLAGALMLGTACCQKSQSVKSSNDASMGETANAANTATLWVRGMACPQCAYNVDLQLMKVPGVESVKVEMNTGRVFATLSPTNPPTRDQLEQAIKDTGFTLVRVDMPATDAGPASFEPNSRS